MLKIDRTLIEVQLQDGTWCPAETVYEEDNGRNGYQWRRFKIGDRFFGGVTIDWAATARGTFELIIDVLNGCVYEHLKTDGEIFFKRLRLSAPGQSKILTDVVRSSMHSEKVTEIDLVAEGDHFIPVGGGFTRRIVLTQNPELGMKAMKMDYVDGGANLRRPFGPLRIAPLLWRRAIGAGGHAIQWAAMLQEGLQDQIDDLRSDCPTGWADTRNLHQKGAVAAGHGIEFQSRYEMLPDSFGLRWCLLEAQRCEERMTVHMLDPETGRPWDKIEHGFKLYGGESRVHHLAYHLNWVDNAPWQKGHCDWRDDYFLTTPPDDQHFSRALRGLQGLGFHCATHPVGIWARRKVETYQRHLELSQRRVGDDEPGRLDRGWAWRGWTTALCKAMRIDTDVSSLLADFIKTALPNGIQMAREYGSGGYPKQNWDSDRWEKTGAPHEDKLCLYWQDDLVKAAMLAMSVQLGLFEDEVKSIIDKGQDFKWKAEMGAKRHWNKDGPADEGSAEETAGEGQGPVWYSDYAGITLVNGGASEAARVALSDDPDFERLTRLSGSEESLASLRGSIISDTFGGNSAAVEMWGHALALVQQRMNEGYE